MRIVKLAFVAAFVTTGALAVAITPAKAAETDVCATWEANGATGAYPAITFGGKPEGTTISRYSAVLTKPKTGVAPGVQFSAKDLGLTLDEATTVSVSYKLSDGATATSGAVRMFGYKSATANTVTDGPDYQDEAKGDEGKLSFSVTGKLSVLGLVYDASNESDGKVTFSDMTIGERKVSFTECPKPTNTATATPTPTVTATPTKTATVKPSPSRSSSNAVVIPTTPRPTAATGATLPVTGPGIGAIVGFGVFIIALGAVSVYGARRKRRFTA